MRKLSDMNNLYNAQDVILFCGIIGNCFQLMYEKYGFNPKKCNSASTFRGCTESDLSKVIIASPTFNKIVDIFEKKRLTGGLSCIITKVPFDTELLFSNTNNMSVDGDDNFHKDYDYEICYKLKFTTIIAMKTKELYQEIYSLMKMTGVDLP